MKLIVALLVIFLFYELQSIIYTKCWIKQLNVSIHFSDTCINEGDSCYLVEVVENNKWLPLPMLYVKFSASRNCIFEKENHSYVTDHYYRYSLYTIGSHQRITRKYPFVCNRRGCYELKDIDVISRDLFLINKLASKFAAQNVMYAKPKLIPYDTIPSELLSTVKKVINQHASYEDPFEFRGIREYQPYDSIRYINWKSSAKTGQLQVNTHFPTISRDVDIYLNLDPNSLSRAYILQETAIRIAYTIASMLTDANITYRFVTNGNDMYLNQPIHLESGAGKNHLNQLGVSMARIDLSQKLVNFSSELNAYDTKDLRSRQMILITTYRKKDLCDAVNHLKEQGLRMYTIIPEFKDIPIDPATFPDAHVWEVDYDETSL